MEDKRNDARCTMHVEFESHREARWPHRNWNVDVGRWMGADGSWIMAGWVKLEFGRVLKPWGGSKGGLGLNLQKHIYWFAML